MAYSPFKKNRIRLCPHRWYQSVIFRLLAHGLIVALSRTTKNNDVTGNILPPVTTFLSLFPCRRPKLCRPRETGLIVQSIYEMTSNKLQQFPFWWQTIRNDIYTSQKKVMENHDSGGPLKSWSKLRFGAN